MSEKKTEIVEEKPPKEASAESTKKASTRRAKPDLETQLSKLNEKIVDRESEIDQLKARKVLLESKKKRKTVAKKS